MEVTVSWSHWMWHNPRRIIIKFFYVTQFFFRTEFSSESSTQNRILHITVYFHWQNWMNVFRKFTFYQLIFLGFYNLYTSTKILRLSDPRWKQMALQIRPCPNAPFALWISKLCPCPFFQCRSIQMHPIPFYSWRWSAGHKLMTPTSSSENRGEK